MDVATSAAQPAGRRFQRRKRILHAGNTPDRERIFGEPADAVPLPGPYMARLAEYTSRISRGRRYRIARQRQEFYRDKQLYTSIYRKVVLPLYLRFQISGFEYAGLQSPAALQRQVRGNAPVLRDKLRRSPPLAPLQPPQSGISDRHRRFLRSGQCNHAGPEPFMVAKAGRFFYRKFGHSVCRDHLVSENLRKREILHLSARRRTADAEVRRSIYYPHGPAGTGGICQRLCGCLEVRGRGAACRAGRKYKDRTFADYLAVALLGYVRGRFFARHQQPESPENPMRRQQPGARGDIRRSPIPL